MHRDDRVHGIGSATALSRGWSRLTLIVGMAVLWSAPLTPARAGPRTQISVFAMKEAREGLEIIDEIFAPLKVKRHASLRAAAARPSRVLILLGPGGTWDTMSPEFEMDEKLRARLSKPENGPSAR